MDLEMMNIKSLDFLISVSYDVGFLFFYLIFCWVLYVISEIVFILGLYL